MENMENIEKIEKAKHPLGQAQKSKKHFAAILQFMTKAKERQLRKKEQTTFFSMLKAAQAEMGILRKNLDFITDTDYAEICMYRLKAAELDFNRHIRLAKAVHFSASADWEESI